MQIIINNRSRKITSNTSSKIRSKSRPPSEINGRWWNLSYRRIFWTQCLLKRRGTRNLTRNQIRQISPFFPCSKAKIATSSSTSIWCRMHRLRSQRQLDWIKTRKAASNPGLSKVFQLPKIIKITWALLRRKARTSSLKNNRSGSSRPNQRQLPEKVPKRKNLPHLSRGTQRRQQRVSCWPSLQKASKMWQSIASLGSRSPECSAIRCTSSRVI